MSDTTFTMNAAFARAQALFKQNTSYCLLVVSAAEVVVLLAALVLTINLGIAVMWLMQLDVAPPETWINLFFISAVVVRIPVDLIVSKIFLLLSGGRKITIDDVLSFDIGFYTPLALRLFLSGLIFALACSGAMVALVVPGVVLASRWQFFRFALIDTDCGVAEGIMESARITRRFKSEAIKTVVATAAMRVLGLVLILIGFVPAQAMALLLEAVSYRQLAEAASDATIVSPVVGKVGN